MTRPGFGPAPTHRTTELPWVVLGRAVKPVAFGLALIMLGLCVYNLLGLGTFGATPLASAYAILTALSAGLLVAGWVGRWQQVAEWGLLISCWVLATRALFIWLTEGWEERGVILSTGAAVIAGGSYLLERLGDD